MMRRVRVLSFVAMTATPLALFAQAKPAPGAAPAAAAVAVDPCPIELMQPTDLGIANLQRPKLAGVKSAVEANKVMTDVSKILFNETKMTNKLGRDMLLAQFIMFYVQYADSAKRGDIGFPGDKTQYVDMLKYTDSLFTVVEKAEPKCAGTVLQWRNFKPFTDRVRAAYAAIGAGAADTAEKLATRAMILNKNGPQPYDVLWRVAKIRADSAQLKSDAAATDKNQALEISFLQTAADRLEGDTLNPAVRSNFLFTLGRIQHEMGDAKNDKAAKDKLYRGAAKAYLQVLKEFPSGDESQYAMQGVTMTSSIVGDTSISNAAVTLVKASPDKFSDATLAQAGVLSTAANRNADALMFFNAAVKRNPYSRDYQYYLAAMMYDSKQTTEMIPVVHKLVDMDPSNPDNITLFTYGFTGISNATKDPTVKKWAIDSVAYYGKLAEDMPHRLSYTDFERQPNRTLLLGTVENKAKVARAFTIEFEFFGKDGVVVQKSTATVASVAPGGTGSFKIDFPIGGVVGVRYAPLPLK